MLIALNTCKSSKRRSKGNRLAVVLLFPGNEDVIHLAGDDNDGINAEMHSAHLTSFSGQCFEKAVIRQDNFFDVAGLSKAKRNNDRDGKKQ